MIYGGNINLFPIHDELKFKEFLKTYNEIIRISKKKDSKSIIKYISENHESQYEYGKKNFNKCWDLDKNPSKSFLWKLLYETLSKGCRKDNDSFVCPYYYNKLPADGSDSHESGLIFGENVNIRQFPSSKSKVISSYSYCYVDIDRSKKAVEEKIGNETYSWVAVSLADGKKGYVYGKYIASGLDCRVIFEKENGKWKISYIACGD